MRIVNYRNITYSEVGRLIENLLNKEFELDQITIRVYEYVNKFNKCPNADALVAELKNMGLKDITAVMIANIVPRDEDEVRILLNFETETIDKDKIAEILDKVNKFCIE